jgi:mono/diheme cytochrome c family protein
MTGRRSIVAMVLAAAAAAPLLAAAAEQPPFGERERGRYLAAAGDCEACHTAENGKPYAGGRGIDTPFGVIYSPNITPDRETGIGAWNDEQFYRALHQGIAADGSHLYPAFPYPWYTKVTRDDARAIRTFLQSLDPVHAQRKPNGLSWPLDERIVMKGWNALFLKDGEFKPNPQKSADWNRGAYLVEGLGHCGACHTPLNMFGAPKHDDRLEGGNLQNWFAPSLAGDLHGGLGGWSPGDIVEFLKTGRNAKTAAYGPMSEVIAHSTSKLSDQDLKAIAAYLKDMPAAEPGRQPKQPDAKVAQAGEAIYLDNCAACHRSNGEGVPAMFPALKGSGVAQSQDPTTAMRLVLEGGHAVATQQRPTPVAMPSFQWKLSDDQVAAVLSYVRSAWGNAAAPVSGSDVGSLRGKLASAGGKLSAR